MESSTAKVCTAPLFRISFSPLADLHEHPKSAVASRTAEVARSLKNNLRHAIAVQIDGLDSPFALFESEDHHQKSTHSNHEAAESPQGPL